MVTDPTLSILPQALHLGANPVQREEGSVCLWPLQGSRAVCGVHGHGRVHVCACGRGNNIEVFQLTQGLLILPLGDP